MLKKFELALTGVKTEGLLSVRFDRTSGEQYAYVSAFAAEGLVPRGVLRHTNVLRGSPLGV